MLGVPADTAKTSPFAMVLIKPLKQQLLWFFLKKKIKRHIYALVN
ncbi:UNVERIFIED_CONTAM: hypothetical protein GTU68_047140 [Idotea baltica]|nr:hypothetical protein [Idotea baltica]